MRGEDKGRRNAGGLFDASQCVERILEKNNQMVMKMPLI